MSLLGEGTYGRIISTDDPNVVIKVINKLDSAVREINFLKYLDDDPSAVSRVIKLLDVKIAHNGNFHLFLPRYQSSLEQHLRSLPDYHASVDFASGLATQLLAGIKYIHSRGVIHSDLSSNNILLGPKGAVICDFGISAFANEINKSACITSLTYRAPEVDVYADYSNHGFVVDLWALGCILFRVLVGDNYLIDDRTPFGASWSLCKQFGIIPVKTHRGRCVQLRTVNAARVRKEVAGRLPEDVPYKLVDLIVGCLIPTPAFRITTNGAWRMFFTTPCGFQQRFKSCISSELLLVTKGLNIDVCKECSSRALSLAERIFMMCIQRKIRATLTMRYCCIYFATIIYGGSFNANSVMKTTKNKPSRTSRNTLLKVMEFNLLSDLIF